MHLGCAGCETRMRLEIPMGCIWSTEYSVHPIYSSLLTSLGIHPSHILYHILYSVYSVQYMVI